MTLLSLFIDESGSANPKVNSSPCYIICGVLIRNQYREKLKVRADQIKFKYWNNTNIIFHSREISRKEGDFAILKDEAVRKMFEKDLLQLLNSGGYQIFTVLVDLKLAYKNNWNELTIYKKTADIIVRNFILSLLAQGTNGRLVTESATSQKDFSYHKAAAFYLSNGIKELKVDYSCVQKALTEIAFVTKKNHDIEEQIADLLAYGAKLKFLKQTKNLTNYQKQLLKIFETKLFVMQPTTGSKKKRYYSKINSFKIIS